MKVEIDKGRNIHKVDFDSLNEFYGYIKKTPINKAWTEADEREIMLYGKDTKKYKEFTAIRSQVESPQYTKWTGVSTIEEAEELFKNGIPEQAVKLTQLLKAEKKMAPVQAMKRVNSIQGFQPIVPLYLMGVPNNMISTQMKPVKQKVVNLYSNLSYLCNVSSEKINNECIKKFRLISKLESQNYRVNLFVIFGTKSGYSKIKQGIVTTIKLKSASERMNISKLAYPLTHPSMERRLIFRFMETYPDTDSEFVHGYGRSFSNTELNAMYPNGCILPEFITKDIDTIKSLDDLKYL